MGPFLFCRDKYYSMRHGVAMPISSRTLPPIVLLRSGSREPTLVSGPDGGGEMAAQLLLARSHSINWSQCLPGGAPAPRIYPRRRQTRQQREAEGMKGSQVDGSIEIVVRILEELLWPGSWSARINEADRMEGPSYRAETEKARSATGRMDGPTFAAFSFDAFVTATNWDASLRCTVVDGIATVNGSGRDRVSCDGSDWSAGYLSSYVCIVRPRCRAVSFYIQKNENENETLSKKKRPPTRWPESYDTCLVWSVVDRVG